MVEMDFHYLFMNDVHSIVEPNLSINFNEIVQITQQENDFHNFVY